MKVMRGILVRERGWAGSNSPSWSYIKPGFSSASLSSQLSLTPWASRPVGISSPAGLLLGEETLTFLTFSHAKQSNRKSES